MLKEIAITIAFAITLIVAALVPTPAQAQTAPVLMPESVPWFFGETTGEDYANSTLAWHVWWYYRDQATNVVKAGGFSCQKGTTVPCLTLNQAEAKVRALRVAAAASGAVVADVVRAAYPPQLDCANVASAVCAERSTLVQPGFMKADRMLPLWPVAASAPVPPPPAASAPPSTETWKVITNGLVLTRPAYQVVNNKPATASTNRARVSTVCDCATVKINQFGLATYCRIPPENLETPTTVLHVATCVLVK